MELPGKEKTNATVLKGAEKKKGTAGPVPQTINSINTAVIGLKFGFALGPDKLTKL